MSLLNGHEAAIRAFNSHPITVIIARGLATVGIAAMLYLANETRQLAKEGRDTAVLNAQELLDFKVLMQTATDDRFRRHDFVREIADRDDKLKDHEDRIRALEQRRR